jgi:hypothetical protein
MGEGVEQRGSPHRLEEAHAQKGRPAIAERRESASRAARESRELAGRLRRRLAQADGTDAATRAAERDRLASIL